MYFSFKTAEKRQFFASEKPICNQIATTSIFCAFNNQLSLDFVPKSRHIENLKNPEKPCKYKLSTHKKSTNLSIDASCALRDSNPGQID